MRSIKKFEDIQIWEIENSHLLTAAKRKPNCGFQVVKEEDYIELLNAIKEERRAHIKGTKKFKLAIKFMKMMNIYNVFSKKFMRN